MLVRFTDCIIIAKILHLISLILIFLFPSFDTSPFDGDYRVIDVDYDRYAVVYSCTQFLFVKYELGWILTREPTVNTSLVGFCKSVDP